MLDPVKGISIMFDHFSLFCYKSKSTIMETSDRFGKKLLGSTVCLGHRFARVIGLLLSHFQKLLFPVHFKERCRNDKEDDSRFSVFDVSSILRMMSPLSFERESEFEDFLIPSIKEADLKLSMIRKAGFRSSCPSIFYT